MSRCKLHDTAKVANATVTLLDLGLPEAAAAAGAKEALQSIQKGLPMNMAMDGALGAAVHAALLAQGNTPASAATAKEMALKALSLGYDPTCCFVLRQRCR